MLDSDYAKRQEFLKWLDSYLGPTRQEIEGARAHDLAIGLANQQKQRWGELLNVLESEDLRARREIYDRLLQLHSVLANAPEATFSTLGDKKIVQSKLPILTSDPPRDRIEQGQEFPHIAAAYLARRCAQFLLEANNGDVGRFLEMTAAAEIVFADDSGGGIWELVGSQLDKAREEFQALKSEGQQAIEQVKSIQEAATEDLERLRSDVQEIAQRAEKINSEVQSAEKERSSAWHKKSEDALRALRDEVNEYIKVEASIDLWRAKAIRHTWAYAVYGAIFGLSLLVITALLLLGYGSQYIDRLFVLPADRQYIAVALLIIPTLAIAWLLRFVARLSIQNLALAQDAQQRHAQINTYLRLLGDPKKPISEHERILALAALFRPLGGQATDDVSPPTIADLLKEAQERITKPNK